MEQGFLLVKAFTANGDLPMPDANIFVTNAEDVALLSVFMTDENGQTLPLVVEAPPAALSLQPEANMPVFTSCNVYARKEGFFNVLVRGVQIFSGKTSLQPINLIPLPEQYGRTTTRVIDITPQNL